MKRRASLVSRRPFRLELPGKPLRIWPAQQAPEAERPYITSLDPGSTHAKASVCQVQDGRLIVLGLGVEPYAGEGRSLEALAGACEAALTQAEDMTENSAGRKIVADGAVIGISASSVLSRMHRVAYERRAGSEPLGNAELMRILSAVQREALTALMTEARKRWQEPTLLLRSSAAQGLLDGGPTKVLPGGRGTSLEIWVFNACAPASAIDMLETLADRLELDPPDIVLQAQAVYGAWRETLGPDGIGIDIGGRHTTVSLWRAGMLCGMVSIPQGGRDVTLCLGRACQADEERAEKLKLRYAHGQFDADQRAWTSDALQPALELWFEAAGAALRTLSGGEPLPPAIWVWGGGAGLRDILAVARALPRYERLDFYDRPVVRILDECENACIENRSGSSMGVMGCNVQALPFGAAARMNLSSQDALSSSLQEATIAVCEAENISYWMPVDG